ncbi:hypothetical protein [Megalodesulfovibrio gigas]|uniref:Uncharacterized protein n=1 Tax=Megalodesulfovibrio gigas (strain ATCC 19364 / DSM 1382 / NCIMB 9332 / VKM B-1759) TaxID=1121448 RepID=T2G894_MEGG1|nr:hypothetical protein [Megalodesulfovibrio gigas]AGW12810.1 hypothetical protein DGI_0922 [Megalodesulfovibrio gigas DSM 1382 = ATCC 19364]
MPPARELIRLGFRVSRLKDWTRDAAVHREIDGIVEEVIRLAKALGEQKAPVNLETEEEVTA